MQERTDRSATTTVHDPHWPWPQPYLLPVSCRSPLKTHSNPNGHVERSMFVEYGEFVEDPDSWVTLREAIKGLPQPVGTEVRNEPPPLDLHFGRKPTQDADSAIRIYLDLAN